MLVLVISIFDETNEVFWIIIVLLVQGFTNIHCAYVCLT